MVSEASPLCGLQNHANRDRSPTQFLRSPGNRRSDEIAENLDSKWATGVSIAYLHAWSLFLAPICRIIFVILRLTSVNGIMSFTVHFEQGGDSSEDALIARLRRFVEDSDLTFYQIASRVGTTGTILSTAPIHESRLRLGDLLKTKRSAERWWSSDKADWKSVVVT